MTTTSWIGLLATAFIIGVHTGDFLERRFLKHGCAERVMTDSVTGKTEFRWRERE